MILGIDVGGTKTLITLFSRDGEIVSELRFETPKAYSEFLKQLSSNIAKFTTEKLLFCTIAMPGRINRKDGIVEQFGNLDWENVPIKSDLAKIIGKIPIAVENDANLAGLSEALSLQPIPHCVLYITISTGIGTGIVTHGKLDPDFIDSEGGHMLFEKDGKLVSWENFASGKAIVKKYGKIAAEIDDNEIWEEIAHDIAIGVVNLSAVIEPDVIIIGGGVGSHFKKFESPLKRIVNEITPDLVKIPEILPAKRAEKAVALGCYYYAKEQIS